MLSRARKELHPSWYLCYRGVSNIKCLQAATQHNNNALFWFKSLNPISTILVKSQTWYAIDILSIKRMNEFLLKKILSHGVLFQIFVLSLCYDQLTALDYLILLKLRNCRVTIQLSNMAILVAIKTLQLSCLNENTIHGDDIIILPVPLRVKARIKTSKGIF